MVCGAGKRSVVMTAAPGTKILLSRERVSGLTTYRHSRKMARSKNGALELAAGGRM